MVEMGSPLVRRLSCLSCVSWAAEERVHEMREEARMSRVGEARSMAKDRDRSQMFFPCIPCDPRAAGWLAADYTDCTDGAVRRW